MSVGTLARRVLGKRLFSKVGRGYRAIFIDLNKTAMCMSNNIPQNAHILDVGGGDGEPLNYLLSLRRDISVTMIDIKKAIGNAVSIDYRDRLKLLPNTDISQFKMLDYKLPNCIVVSDVIHHIPKNERNKFFQDIHELMVISKAKLLIKEIEPGYFISKLSYLSDRFISGDKMVNLISKQELRQAIDEIFLDNIAHETGLFNDNKPNYLLSVELM